MKILRFFSILAAFLASACSQSRAADPSLDAGQFYSFQVRKLDGSPVHLEQYRGKVALIVNTASKCGFTPQYEGLEALFQEFESRGLVILGFPSNDFGGQEPGSNGDIAHFCRLNYGVSFPMFEKAPVSGAEMQPLYRYLTKQANRGLTGEVKWNFEKFLIDRRGRLRARYSSFAKPLSADLKGRIEELLAEGSVTEGSAIGGSAE